MEEQLASKIREIMINVSTGRASIEDMNPPYQKLYNELDKKFRESGKVNPNPFSDLWEFHQYWKENLPTYADRRVFVIQLYKQSKKHEPDDFWNLLHDAIVAVSRTRFQSNHYADAVEAAFKEVNSRIKGIVLSKTGEEFDGSSLMKKAFSLNKPIVVLDDINTESGRNVQQGYMELFSGAMMGIRNPKAHANVDITRDRAIHCLHLASLLMFKVDESLWIAP